MRATASSSPLGSGFVLVGDGGGGEEQGRDGEGDLLSPPASLSSSPGLIALLQHCP